MAVAKRLRDRNPFASVEEDPITKAQCEELFDALRILWEDTELVTKPNGVSIGLNVGNLRAICLMMLRGEVAD